MTIVGAIAEIATMTRATSTDVIESHLAPQPEFVTEIMHSPRPSPSTRREPDSERNDGSALPWPRDHSLLLVSDGIGKRS